jgi:hypothetical protein
MMGYANVFNQYGRWGFYSANSEAFSYEEKTKYFYELVKSTLAYARLREQIGGSQITVTPALNSPDILGLYVLLPGGGR